MMRRLGMFATLLCVCAISAFADQVTLKNGDRLTGTIVKTDEKEETLLIKTELAGDVSVKWDSITSIVSSQPLHLALKDGQTIVGAVTTADGTFDVVHAHQVLQHLSDPVAAGSTVYVFQALSGG